MTAMNAAEKLSVNENTAPVEKGELTDGFHLVIDALKLNGIETIYGVPGIPITDFGRMAQAAGIRDDELDRPPRRRTTGTSP